MQLHDDQVRHYVHGLYALAYRDLTFAFCTFAYILLDFFTTGLRFHSTSQSPALLTPFRDGYTPRA